MILTRWHSNELWQWFPLYDSAMRAEEAARREEAFTDIMARRRAIREFSEQTFGDIDQRDLARVELDAEHGRATAAGRRCRLGAVLEVETNPLALDGAPPLVVRRGSIQLGLCW